MTKINAYRSADVPLTYTFPADTDLTGYTSVFTIYDAMGGTSKLVVNSTPTANGSYTSAAGNVLSVLIKAADINTLPLATAIPDPGDTTSPAILFYDHIVTTTHPYTLKPFGGAFVLHPYGSPVSADGYGANVSLDGYNISVQVAAAGFDSSLPRLGPHSFGAAFDGVTDDTVAWQAFAAIVNVQGYGNYYIPRGVSVVNGDVKFLNLSNGAQKAATLIESYGGCVIGTGKIIFEGCKYVTVTGLNLGLFTAAFRGFWFSKFDGCILDYQVIGDQVSSTFPSFLSNRWIDCALGKIRVDVNFSNTSGGTAYMNANYIIGCWSSGTIGQGLGTVHDWFFEVLANKDVQSLIIQRTVLAAGLYTSGYFYYNPTRTQDLLVTVEDSYLDLSFAETSGVTNSNVQIEYVRCHQSGKSAGFLTGAPLIAALKAPASAGSGTYRMGWRNTMTHNIAANGDLRVRGRYLTTDGGFVSSLGGATMTPMYDDGVTCRNHYLRFTHGATASTVFFTATPTVGGPQGGGVAIRARTTSQDLTFTAFGQSVPRVIGTSWEWVPFAIYATQPAGTPVNLTIRSTTIGTAYDFDVGYYGQWPGVDNDIGVLCAQPRAIEAAYPGFFGPGALTPGVPIGKTAFSATFSGSTMTVAADPTTGTVDTANWVYGANVAIKLSGQLTGLPGLAGTYSTTTTVGFATRTGSNSRVAAQIIRASMSGSTMTVTTVSGPIGSGAVTGTGLSATGSVNGNVLTLTAWTSGVFGVGSTITRGTFTTTITQQTATSSGDPNGRRGTYLLTDYAPASGDIEVGDTITLGAYSGSVSVAAGGGLLGDYTMNTAASIGSTVCQQPWTIAAPGLAMGWIIDPNGEVDRNTGGVTYQPWVQETDVLAFWTIGAASQGLPPSAFALKFMCRNGATFS